MEKKLILEEITRIHEMMGIKSNKKNLLLEGWREIFGVGAREYATGGGSQALRSNFKQGIEDLTPNYGTKRSGGYMSFDDVVELGGRYAREAGVDVVDEAGALAYFFREAGQNAMNDYQKLLTKLRIQRMEAAAQALEGSATARGKAALKSFQDDMVEVRRQLDAGEIDLPTFKSSMDSLVAVIKGTKTTKANQAIKDTLVPEMEKTAKELDDLAGSLPEAGAERVGIDFAKDLEQRVQKELDDLSAAERAAREAEEAEARRIARETEDAEDAARRKLKNDFDDLLDSLKGTSGRMSKSGLGKLPWWMNTYKSKIIKELEKVKNDYLSGKITKEQLEELADTELEKAVKQAKVDADNATGVTRAKAKLRAEKWQKFYDYFKRGRPFKITILVIILTSIFGLAPVINYLANRKDEISETLDARELKKCFGGQLDELTDDQLSKFAKLGFTCEGNRNNVNSPGTFVSKVAYVGKGKDNPDMFVVDVGTPPVKKYYDASSGVEIPAPGSVTPTVITPPNQTTVDKSSDAKSAAEAEYPAFTATGVERDVNDGNIYTITMKSKTGDNEVKIKRKWDGSKFVQL